jgi:uncharacterized protein (DUF433 family)
MVTEIVRPSYSGVYLITDASLFIRATTPMPPTRNLTLSTNQLFRWVHEGFAGKYLVGLHGEEVALTFPDLVSFRLVSVYRAHGVPPKEIRRIHDVLRSVRGWMYPFAMEPTWIAGRNILIEEAGAKVSISRGWQRALDFTEEHIVPAHRLVFGENQQAASWEPHDGIVLDPAVNFGSPCLKGTRIATETIWALHAAGEPDNRIADAYSVARTQIDAALAWERRLGFDGT